VSGRRPYRLIVSSVDERRSPKYRHRSIGVVGHRCAIQRRGQQGYGFWPSLLRPLRALRAPPRYPSFCVKDSPTCTGSPTARNQSLTGVLGHASCCLLQDSVWRATEVYESELLSLIGQLSHKPGGPLRAVPHGHFAAAGQLACLVEPMMEKAQRHVIARALVNAVAHAIKALPQPGTGRNACRPTSAQTVAETTLTNAGKWIERRR